MPSSHSLGRGRYGSAAAIQILHGKMLYRDFWFDKPPLAALVYVLWQGAPGFGLRLAGAIYAFACAVAAYRFADHLWGRREAWCAALLLAFFLLFDHPATVMTLAPDLLLVLPAIAARGLCSAATGVPGGTVVFRRPRGQCKSRPRRCRLSRPGAGRPALPLVAGLAAGTVPWLLWLLVAGALPGYWEQVWWFGAQYSRNTFIAHPLREGLVRTLNWAGFHAALVVGSFWWGGASPCGGLAGRLQHILSRTRRRVTPPQPTGLPHKIAWLIWLLAGFASTVAGERFFPRYYFLLLPPLVLLAARGFALSKRPCLLALLGLLLIPLIRFGPRYLMLASDLIEHRSTTWADVALNDDSKQAAHLIDQSKKPKTRCWYGDTGPICLLIPSSPRPAAFSTASCLRELLPIAT